MSETYRKRDRFWKFIFPHYKQQQPQNDNYYNKNKSKNSINPVHRDSEQKSKINSLQNYAKKNFSITLDPELFESILENNNWDSKQSIIDLTDYEEASHGILVEPPRTPDRLLLGSENDGGTSCYIDALLFAMFIANTAFDPLLTYDIPTTEEEDEKKTKLQMLLRLFVNKLRKGHIIKADYVHWFRKVLQEVNWNGKDGQGQWTQEDASELFLFITETFDLPYLPFQIRLFHGGNKDKDDDRVMTDRTLTLSIPDDDSIKEVKLQDILVDYFYNNIITGVMRHIDDNFILSENVAASPTVQTYSNNKIMYSDNNDFVSSMTRDEKYTLKKLLEKSDGNDHQELEVPVTAWQVLELLPFYSATNEQGEAIETQLDSSFPDTHMILPIVLKRYRYDPKTGNSTKMKKRVEVPVTIDFNKFVNQNVEDPMCPICGHLVNWTLHFKSAVCHLGNSPYSGHYISYARITTDNNNNVEDSFWLKFDDMNTENRVMQIINDEDDKNPSIQQIKEDLSENAYILFYELDKTCHHPPLPPYYSSNEDDEEEESIHTKDDFKPSIDQRENYTNKKKSKSRHRRRHQHHRHHFNERSSRLKDSCRIM
ncbi:uncharacterized protein BX663DRAFT_493389 [Cokeromyces recurvatus]|uniref:uncharacterized protein n=1 Tax=Cokeromyces recurvatus TaxID=90255 RepID=UPI0022204B1E|nr:uncharacterized protein BX663DRAFT_493389 [Cokeromyces recurvatus]KAI7908209.1 hypothetical protein BX663DRAFT_493389 [Cokeromyces recurvatus]